MLPAPAAVVAPASKAPVFTAAGSIDQLATMTIAIAPKKSASAAVIIQSGLTPCSATAVTASSFAAARASRASDTSAGACTAESAGEATCRREEGMGACMVSLLVVAVLMASVKSHAVHVTAFEVRKRSGNCLASASVIESAITSMCLRIACQVRASSRKSLAAIWLICAT